MFQAIVVFLHKGAITEVILVAIQFHEDAKFSMSARQVLQR